MKTQDHHLRLGMSLDHKGTKDPVGIVKMTKIGEEVQATLAQTSVPMHS